MSDRSSGVREGENQRREREGKARKQSGDRKSPSLLVAAEGPFPFGGLRRNRRPGPTFTFYRLFPVTFTGTPSTFLGSLALLCAAAAFAAPKHTRPFKVQFSLPAAPAIE
ncbi:hypothetical protein ACLOJK_014368 [Asimina triloba]